MTAITAPCTIDRNAPAVTVFGTMNTEYIVLRERDAAGRDLLHVHRVPKVGTLRHISETTGEVVEGYGCFDATRAYAVPDEVGGRILESRRIVFELADGGRFVTSSADSRAYINFDWEEGL